MNGKRILACLALVAACVASASPFGVCSHVTRDEFDERVRTYGMMREAGFTDVRSDFDWHRCQKAKDAPLDFSKYDKVVDDAAKYGVTVLPILYGIPKWAQPVYEHLDEWRAFVRETVRHFKGRIPVYEIWNEENINGFWKDPDPVKYAAVLKAAYEEVKQADPSARVAFGGTAGCDSGYIEKAVRAGAKDSFDIVNVHPYRHPHPPEPELTDDLNALKKMMARNGIAGRPIWITELGWPTHKATVPDAPVFRAGLKIARPEQKRWRAAYVDIGLPGASAGVLAAAVRENLPPGSSCANVTAAELNARLPKGDFDLVVYPFGESFPDDTIDAVVEFVRQGGTLVVCGGYPLYFPYRNGKYAGSSPQGAKEGAAARDRLRLGVEAWWANKAMPQSAKTFPSEEAKKVGLAVDPAGLAADRFFSARLLKPGDRMVPLLVGKDKDGGAAVGACVYLFGSDLKGRVVVSSRGRSTGGTSTEAQQADYTVKAIDSALRQGVEKYFIYEFRAVEHDPYYSEHHFGIVHKDFSPKPAYTACRDYIQGKTKRTNPILDGWYADPQIRRYGAACWIFPTYSHDYREQTFLDVFSSPDLKTWTKHPHAVDAKDFAWVRGAMWAPDAHEKDGKYYVFFAANDAYPVGGKRTDGEPQSEPGIGQYGGIGVAVADRPEGPYRDLIGKPLVDRFWNAAQPIDQYVFRYQGGWYMVYGGWGKCNLVRLADDFKSLVPFDDGQMWKDLTPPEYTEGSVMFERKGVWYFMYSSGGWTDGSYSVKYCTAPTPFGPFDFKGSVLSSQPPLATGAGHHSVLNLPGTDEWYVCYHRRPIPNSSPHHRVTCLDRMTFDEQGNINPVVMTGGPSPCYDDDAFPFATREDEARRIAAELDAIVGRAAQTDTLVDKSFAPLAANAFERIRLGKRREVRARTEAFARRYLRRGDATGLGFAEQAVADLELMDRILREEAENVRVAPRPENNPAVFRLADFGAKGDGRTDDAAAFEKAFAAVRALGGKPAVLKLGKGTFFIGSRRTAPAYTSAFGQREDGGVLTANLPVWGLENCAIEGEGPEATALKFGEYELSGLAFLNCRNCRIRQVECSFAQQPFLEGEVLAVDRQPEVVAVDLRLVPGSLTPDAACWNPAQKRGVESFGYEFKPSGEMIQPARLIHWDSRSPDRCRALGGDRWRIFFRRTFDPENFDHHLKGLVVGGYLAIPNRCNFYPTVKLFDCSHTLVEDVWIRNSRAAAVEAYGRCHMTSFNRLRVFPMPGFHQSSDADGCFCAPGTFLYDCHFEAMGDDGMNSLSNFTYVEPSADGLEVTRKQDWGTNPKGSLVVFFDPETGRYLANRRVRETDAPGRATTRLDRPVPATVKGKVMIAPRFRGIGTIVSGCTWKNGRWTGVVLQTPDALVENCEFDNIWQEAVRPCFYGDFNEGIPPYNVLIRNCRVRDCCSGVFCRYRHSADGRKTWAKPAVAPIRGIEVSGCDFRGTPLGAIVFEHAGDCRTSDNRFDGRGKDIVLNGCEEMMHMTNKETR